MLEWFLDCGKCPICDEPIPASPFYPPHFGLTEEKMVVRPDGIQLSREGVIELMQLEKTGVKIEGPFIIDPGGLEEIFKQKSRAREDLCIDPQ